MSRPWMPLYVADLTLDTAHLSAAEFGGYLRLIAHYWAKQCLPRNEAMLQRICGMASEEWALCRPAIASFFEIIDGGWVHHRIERELQISENKYEIRAAAGRRGGKAKASNAKAKSYQLQPQPHISSSLRSDDKPPAPKSENSVVRKPRTTAKPLEILKTVLSEKTACDVIDHRKAKRAPLTPRAAELLVAAFRDHGDCEAAAEAMIAGGWQGFKSEWVSNARGPPSGRGRSNGNEGFVRSVLEDIEDDKRRREEGDPEAVPGLQLGGDRH